MKSFTFPWKDTQMEQKQAEPKTMFEKIWDAHVVRESPGELPFCISIDISYTR